MRESLQEEPPATLNDVSTVDPGLPPRADAGRDRGDPGQSAPPSDPGRTRQKRAIPAGLPWIPQKKGEGFVDTWARISALSVGGVAGVNARYWLGVWINRWASSQFPWATFTINVSGAFAIGFLIRAGPLVAAFVFTVADPGRLSRWLHDVLDLRIRDGDSLAARRISFEPDLRDRQRAGRVRGRGSGGRACARNRPAS